MALIKYSPVVGEASGKAGGAIFSRNKGGNYIRAWSMPTDPRTSAQTSQRAKVSQLSTIWSGTLVESQRQGWIESASLADHTVTNRLGETKKLSGFQYFMKMNLIALTLGEDILTDSPAVIPTPVMVDTSVDLSVATGVTIELKYDNQYEPFELGEKYIIDISAGSPAGRKPGGTKFLAVAGSGDTGDVAVTVLDQTATIVISPALVASKVGGLVAGKRYAVKVRSANPDYPWDQITAQVEENSSV